MCVLVTYAGELSLIKQQKLAAYVQKKHECAAYKVHSWVSTDTVVDVTMNLLHCDTFAQTSLVSTFLLAYL